MRTLLSLFATVVFCLSPSFTMADFFIPEGLKPGDEYQLVFVTQGTIDATSDDIGVYNEFVNAQAAFNPVLTGTDVDVTWSAIASTPTVDAIENALVVAPVYLLNSEQVATGFVDLWDGSISAAISIDQFGAATSGFKAWTGSFADGTAAIDRELGSEASGLAFTGDADRTDALWIQNGVLITANQNHVYALSSRLTVPSAVPEPTVVVVLLGSCFVGILRRKR